MASAAEASTRIRDTFTPMHLGSRYARSRSPAALRLETWSIRRKGPSRGPFKMLVSLCCYLQRVGEDPVQGTPVHVGSAEGDVGSPGPVLEGAVVRVFAVEYDAGVQFVDFFVGVSRI